LSGKLAAKFAETTIVKIAHLIDVFSEIFEPEVSSVEVQSLLTGKNIRKGEKEKAKNIPKSLNMLMYIYRYC